MTKNLENCEIAVNLGPNGENFALEALFNPDAKGLTVTVDNLQRMVRAAKLFDADNVTFDLAQFGVEPTSTNSTVCVDDIKEGDVYHFANDRIVFDAFRRTITTDGTKRARVSPITAQIMKLLCEHMDEPLSREYIYDSVMPPDSSTATVSIRGYITRIRASFGAKELRSARTGALRSIGRLNQITKYKHICDYALVSRL